MPQGNMSASSDEHERQAAREARDQPVRCAVLTISDTRDLDRDESGALVQRLLAGRGHEIVARDLVPDEPQFIAARLEQWLGNPQIQAVLTTGGTGISPRDNTIEVVRGLAIIVDAGADVNEQMHDGFF